MTKKKWFYLLLWIIAFFALAIGWSMVANILFIPAFIKTIVALLIGVPFGVKVGFVAFDKLN